MAYGGICDQTEVSGNISADPLFVDPVSGDFHLQPNSPAIDAGDNTAPSLPATDFDGDHRIVDGNGDGVAVVDMGVDEFAPFTPFAAFDARVIIVKRALGIDRLVAKGTFTLGDASDGIDPMAEPVVFSVADTDGSLFGQTLPPDSFQRIGQGGFRFRAPEGECRHSVDDRQTYK